MTTKTHPEPTKKRITLAEFETLSLAHGSHGDRSNGLCALEAAAWIAGEPHGDHPACVSPTIAAFCRQWNDDLGDDDRNRLLKPLIPKMVGTAGTPEQETRRAWLVIDWTVRTHTVAFLRVAKLDAEAKSLSDLPEIVGPEQLDDAVKALEPIRARQAAAWDAARAAARAAAWDAARAAARDAARDAAWAAAWAAARAAARAAAWDALKPIIVAELQASAVALVERMIAVTAEAA